MTHYQIGCKYGVREEWHLLKLKKPVIASEARQCLLFNVGRVKRSVPVRWVATLTGMSLRSFAYMDVGEGREQDAEALPVLHC